MHVKRFTSAYVWRSKKLLFKIIVLFLTVCIVVQNSHSSSVVGILLIVWSSIPKTIIHLVHLIHLIVGLILITWRRIIKILFSTRIIALRRILSLRIREIIWLILIGKILLPKIAVSCHMYLSRFVLNGFFSLYWGIGGSFYTDFCFSEYVWVIWSSVKLYNWVITVYQTHELCLKTIVWIEHFLRNLKKTQPTHIFEVLEFTYLKYYSLIS